METRSNHLLVGTIVLVLLAGALLFTVWLAGLSTKKSNCFDIYFAQGVGGVSKGTSVNYSGVPVGEVEKIALLPNRPEFVWVRIKVDSEAPILQGTTAQIKGVGFTGASEVSLDGAVKGGKPIDQQGPQGCPVIPSATGGLGALLNSAPELLDRIQRLTERLTELLSDKNQNSIADILENMDKTSKVLAAKAPDLANAIGDARIAARDAGLAAQRVGILADSTNRLVNEQGKPAAEDLRKAIGSVQRAADNLDAVVADARPGLNNFTKSTLPEANRLVHDLRDLSNSLQGFSERLNEHGIGGALGPPKLPDYKPGKRP
ncbi:MAG: MlaD family protein [Sphingomicrobium sp.]|nr:MlaD family protein [Sphingomonadales bacterium]